MARLLEGTETTPHRVEWYQRNQWHVADFDTPGDAYRFWLGLRRGVQALLYQDGKCVARGNGLESN